MVLAEGVRCKPTASIFSERRRRPAHSGDDAQGSTKPGSLETSPQFSAIVTAGGPLRVEPWKMRLE